MHLPRIIGLTGLAGSVKDTVRAMFEQDHGYSGLAFADPMRRMLASLIEYVGADPLYMSERAFKEALIPQVGASYRELAQTLGTEWGRAIRPDLWVRMAEARLDSLRHAHRGATEPLRVVISDVRFLNEAEWIRDAGGEVWRIERPNVAPVRHHQSERELLQIHADQLLLNDGSMEDLWVRVSTLCEARVLP